MSEDVGYEFSARQDEVISRLALWMGSVAGVALLLGGAIWLGVFHLWTRYSFHQVMFVPMVEGVVMLASGFWTGRAARRFYSITTTRGRDVTHLMEALASQHSLFAFWAVVIVLHVVFVLACIASLIWYPTALFDFVGL
jgi:hypothetical protein